MAFNLVISRLETAFLGFKNKKNIPVFPVVVPCIKRSTDSLRKSQRILGGLGVESGSKNVTGSGVRKI